MPSDLPNIVVDSLDVPTIERLRATWSKRHRDALIFDGT